MSAAISAAHLRRIAALKLPAEAASEVLSIIADMQEADERRREKQRNRKRHERDSHATNHGQSRDNDNQTQCLASGVDGEAQGVVLPAESNAEIPEQKECPHTPIEKLPFSSPTSLELEEGEEEQDGRRWSFDEFWELYPHKVAKKAAARIFHRLRKSKTIDFTELIAGLLRYAAKTDDRPWCNPATWLNEGRWEDQPAENTGLTNGTARQSTSGGFIHGRIENAQRIDRDRTD